MKKLLLTAFVAFVGIVSANAQIEQGTILVGASSNVGFTSVSPDGGDSYSQFDLNARAGYFFIENVVGGLILDYNKVDEFSQTGFGLFGRYYINGAIILGANFTTNKRDFGSSGDASYTGLGLEGGYAAFITDAIAIEPTLNLNLYSGDIDETQFGFRVGFSLYLGRGE